MEYPIELQKVVHSNYRVEVTPDLGQWLFPKSSPEAQYRHNSNVCKEIASSIKRHVDGINSVEFLCDSKFVCKFCGEDPEPLEKLSGFDEDEIVGMPYCCEKAQDAWKELMKETK